MTNIGRSLKGPKGPLILNYGNLKILSFASYPGPLQHVNALIWWKSAGPLRVQRALNIKLWEFRNIWFLNLSGTLPSCRSSQTERCTCVRKRFTYYTINFQSLVIPVCHGLFHEFSIALTYRDQTNTCNTS